MEPHVEREPASFRDPSGFVYRRDGELLRQVNLSYAGAFDQLLRSGLYDHLVHKRLLVEHEEVELGRAAQPGAYRVLRPAPIPFISYPYEWTFGQLQAAALVTLEALGAALARGMVLKDASAYNIQFIGVRPLLIDTLSFEPWVEGRPWVGYRQFCQHFLGPLALMAYRDPRLGTLSRVHLDGVPLDLSAALLPRRTWLRPSIALHLHLHARAQRKHAPTTERSPAVPRFTRAMFEGLVDSLRHAVAALRLPRSRTEWSGYYAETNYTPEAFEAKRTLVREMADQVRPRLAWDLGANTGEFSREVAARGAYVVAFDSDLGAVERHFRSAAPDSGGVLPLVQDLANPSPSQGWGGAERSGLAGRGPADLVMALALVHHLAIGNNVPLPRIATYLAGLGRHLLIEFVDLGDSQLARLMRGREDIFRDYHRAAFDAAFLPEFELLRAEEIAGTRRTLLLYRSRRFAC